MHGSLVGDFFLQSSVISFFIPFGVTMEISWVELVEIESNDDLKDIYILGYLGWWYNDSYLEVEHIWSMKENMKGCIFD